MKNAGEALKEFEKRINIEVRRQEKIDITKERNFKRGELLEKFTAKILYKWNDGKFEEEYLKKLERNWRKWKVVSLKEKS